MAAGQKKTRQAKNRWVGAVRRTAGQVQAVELKGQEEGVVRTLQTAKVKSDSAVHQFSNVFAGQLVFHQELGGYFLHTAPVLFQQSARVAFQAVDPCAQLV